jgi:hypothetical protein
MIEEVTLDFVVANDREPRDKQELAEWCKAQKRRMDRDDPL